MPEPKTHFVSTRTVSVILNPTDDRNWVGYPSVRGVKQKTFYLQVTQLKDSYVSAICKHGIGGSLRSFNRPNWSDAVEVALDTLEATMAEVFVEAPPVVTPTPETFLIECEHCAVVPGPEGTTQVVVFNPKGDTVERALAWKKAGDRRYVEIDDRVGLHIRKVAALVIHYVFDYGTLWLGLDR